MECQDGGLFCTEEMIGSPWSGDSAEVLDESPDNADLAALTDFPPRDDAALQSVVSRERSQTLGDGYLLALQRDASVLHARAVAVNWMLKVRNVYAFSPMTAALASSYLDRYLSRHLPKSLKAWAIQLLSIACISLAAKMEEIVVPCLPDLQVEGLEHVFEAKTIQRMELVVLKTLDWRMCGVTAFEYVDDLLYRLDISKHLKASILARITELILGTLSEPEFLVFRPSAIALAAFSCALDEIVPLKAATYQRVLLMALPTDQATLHQCYRLIEDLIIDPVCPGVSLGQTFGSSKSPPSPMTVIDLYQAGGGGSSSSMDWCGSQVNLKKRRIEVESQSVRKKLSSSMANSGDHSVWDLF
ncbi:hypothetical protein SELMODRAFT_412774 [Selaginella moellendorffii]|uniref:Uncharacterized protein CYCD1-1 n=1 Tax=Selaginella moellendorffii TaxID=88036 RepID=D8RLF9_SELML|nr:cyclin-D1-1 [Selaginella moellendorffii]EFJ27122.1 hypothetical protein SELMODRAFT_412774 [Selaginella moellendorffii]|eukprot:XP_002972205.1 cyclin-D1-1 [Selaginella moellendorffii]